MVYQTIRALLRTIIVAACMAGVHGEAVPLAEAEVRGWILQLLPLPQEIAITAQRQLDPGDVGMRGRPDAAGLERQAVADLAALFKEKTGIAPEGKRFEIIIGLLDERGQLFGLNIPESGRMASLPNSDQAYVIQPAGENMLAVAALHERGLYYGTHTLAQWLELNADANMVKIPMARVVDWPDLEERGFWHMPVTMAPWLASLKMNRIYNAVPFSVRDDGLRLSAIPPRADAATRQAWTPPYHKARQYAMEVAAGPGHFDYWEKCSGYAEHYPGLLGQGASAWNPAALEANVKQRVPCASNPEFARFLATIMTNLAAEGVAEIMAWMSEYPAAHCACVECVKTGQYVAEVQAAVAAWQQAKAQYPNLKLSVFFGRGGLASAKYPLPERYPDAEIKRIMEMLPPEVTMRASMGCDGADGRLLADYAAQGHRISRMNVVVMAAAPRFHSDDIRARFDRMFTEKYMGAWQFAPFRGLEADALRKTHGFRLSALAEYSWNVGGRSAEEFAAAWAARQGMRQPEKFLAWRDACNQIPQALRMSRCWPRCGRNWYDDLPAMVAARKWDVKWFQTGEPEAGIDLSQKALELAEALDVADLILDSRLMLAYSQLELAGVRLVSNLGDATAAAPDADKTVRLQRLFEELRMAANTYVRAQLAVREHGGCSDMAVARKDGADWEAGLNNVNAALTALAPAP